MKPNMQQMKKVLVFTCTKRTISKLSQAAHEHGEKCVLAANPVAR